MLKADTSISGMVSNLVELTVAIWVKFGFGSLETVKGLRRPFWTKRSSTLDKGLLKLEKFLGG